MKRKWIIALGIVIALASIAITGGCAPHHQALPQWLELPEGTKVLITYKPLFARRSAFGGERYYLRMEWPGKAEDAVEKISSMLQANGFRNLGEFDPLIIVDSVSSVKFADEWSSPDVLLWDDAGGVAYCFEEKVGGRWINIIVFPRGEECLVQVVEGMIFPFPYEQTGEREFP